MSSHLPYLEFLNTLGFKFTSTSRFLADRYFEVGVHLWEDQVLFQRRSGR